MSFSSQRLVFPSPGRVEVQPFLLPLPTVADVLIETDFSIVSPGTELACLSGGEAWAPLPFVPGYGSVGRVVAAGLGAEKFTIGQRVFTYGVHARHARCDVVTLPLPEGADPMLAVFARMAGVAMTALRVSDAELGDTVAVFGLGLVGNLAAQLFTLAGCEVIGIDLSPARRELAKRCGIAHALAPDDSLHERIAALTAGRLCETVVEATGSPRVAEAAPTFAGQPGEVILLGSPRGAHVTDLTPFLNHVHLWKPSSVTLKGAHEWRYPVRADAGGHVKHSIERNVRCALRLIAEGRLQVAPLLTHRAAPKDCQSVYDGLATQKDAYLGVVFDWARV